MAPCPSAVAPPQLAAGCNGVAWHYSFNVVLVLLALRCRVQFTPTVEHCSMATLIGLCIRVKLLRVLPPRFKVRRKRAGGVWLCSGG